MIPVRVPSAMMPVLAGERRMTIQKNHPLHDEPCPVCDGPLGEAVTVLVFAGIEPGDRKPSGWTTGAAVAVHAACAGVPEERPEVPPRTVTFDITGPDARHVLTQALEDYAAAKRAEDPSFARWADLADQMKAQAEAATG